MVEGPELKLDRLTRADMGAYLCIAKNGIPSPVSKRIMIHVHCKFKTAFHNIFLKYYYQNFAFLQHLSYVPNNCFRFSSSLGQSSQRDRFCCIGVDDQTDLQHRGVTQVRQLLGHVQGSTRTRYTWAGRLSVGGRDPIWDFG